jgi:hypothetical protein
VHPVAPLHESVVHASPSSQLPQLVQETAPAPAYEPGAQVSQAEAPLAAANLPAGQGTQALAPGVAAKVPGAHAVHAAEPAAAW